jgi:hypothetical protein
LLHVSVIYDHQAFINNRHIYMLVIYTTGCKGIYVTLVRKPIQKVATQKMKKERIVV